MTRPALASLSRKKILQMQEIRVLVKEGCVYGYGHQIELLVLLCASSTSTVSGIEQELRKCCTNNGQPAAYFLCDLRLVTSSL